MKFSVFQMSRKGGRVNNEDRMGYSYTRDSAVFLVADGMGGHPEGETAAELALQTVSALFQRQAQPRLADVRGFLTDALIAAHHRLLRYAARKRLADTPRTTLVAVVLQDGRATWLHCGDSRLYLLRGGELVARTRDHSYAERPGLHGGYQPPGGRSILYTCLGSPEPPVFDIVGPTTLCGGDRLLLCSDGLWDVLGNHEIAAIAASHPPAAAVPELVARALRNGGPDSDNVTALGIEWEGAVEGAPSAISTATIPPDAYASTIQASLFGAGIDDLHDDLDDATIERTIAEINDAIRAAAARRAPAETTRRG